MFSNREAKPGLDIGYYLHQDSRRLVIPAVVMDLYSHLDSHIPCQRPAHHLSLKRALLKAIGCRKPEPGLIHHSDQGIQYACDEYRELLQGYGMIGSMSRSGNCLDNAVAKRIFQTLKTECLVNWRNMSSEEVKTAGIY